MTHGIYSFAGELQLRTYAGSLTCRRRPYRHPSLLGADDDHQERVSCVVHSQLPLQAVYQGAAVSQSISKTETCGSLNMLYAI